MNGVCYGGKHGTETPGGGSNPTTPINLTQKPLTHRTLGNILDTLIQALIHAPSPGHLASRCSGEGDPISNPVILSSKSQRSSIVFVNVSVLDRCVCLCVSGLQTMSLQLPLQSVCSYWAEPRRSFGRSTSSSWTWPVRKCRNGAHLIFSILCFLKYGAVT